MPRIKLLNNCFLTKWCSINNTLYAYLLKAAVDPPHFVITPTSYTCLVTLSSNPLQLTAIRWRFAYPFRLLGTTAAFKRSSLVAWSITIWVHRSYKTAFLLWLYHSSNYSAFCRAATC